ncbi:MAG: hypothetical protein AAF636_11425 [Pseudomonadota bacterium]
MEKIPKNISVPRNGAGLTARQTDDKPVTAESEEKEYNLWSCPADEVSGLSVEQMVAHLKDRHGINAESTQCTRRLMIHIDGKDFFINHYEITIGKIVLINEVKQSRSAEDNAWRF